VRIAGIILGLLTASIFCKATTCAKSERTVSNNRIVVYPAPAGELLNTNYKVSVSGKELPVYTAKIAANDKPYQFDGIADIRNSHKYYDEAAFAYFDLLGKATITVSIPGDVHTAKILPLSAGIKPVLRAHSITFQVNAPSNLTIEINGVWLKSLHLFINPLESDIPKQDDPNVIYFGPGIHEISHLEIGDNKTVYIAGGAIVRAIIDPKEKYWTSSADSMRNYVPTLSLRGRNIKIRGRGIIDASACSTHSRNLLLVQGRHIQLEGIILRDPSTWTVPIRQSDSVTVDNIKILGYRANSDGIDICNSRDVTVKNCFLRTMDDLVVVKADKDQGDVKRILVTKCVLWNQLAHALSIGAELRDNVDDVVFSDCDVIHDKGREWVLRVYQCDAGLISNIRFEDIRVEEGKRFISLWIGKAIWSRDKEYGYIRNISFKNISALGTPLTVELTGKDDQHGIKDVFFESIRINGDPLTRDAVKINGSVTNMSLK
jgi:hypothetical protein